MAVLMSRIAIAVSQEQVCHEKDMTIVCIRVSLSDQACARSAVRGDHVH